MGILSSVGAIRIGRTKVFRSTTMLSSGEDICYLFYEGIQPAMLLVHVLSERNWFSSWVWGVWLIVYFRAVKWIIILRIVFKFKKMEPSRIVNFVKLLDGDLTLLCIFFFQICLTYFFTIRITCFCIQFNEPKSAIIRAIYKDSRILFANILINITIWTKYIGRLVQNKTKKYIGNCNVVRKNGILCCAELWHTVVFACSFLNSLHPFNGIFYDNHSYP